MKTLFLRKQFLPLFLLLTGIFLADSCTIQKRVHLGGYSIERKHHYKDTENQVAKEQDETASGQKVQSEEESPAIKEESEQGITISEEETVNEPVTEIVAADPETVEQDDPKTGDATRFENLREKVYVSPIVRSLIKRDGEDTSRRPDSYLVGAIVFGLGFILAGIIMAVIYINFPVDLITGFLAVIAIFLLFILGMSFLIMDIVFGCLSIQKIEDNPGKYLPKWVTVVSMIFPFLVLGLAILGNYIYQNY